MTSREFVMGRHSLGECWTRWPLWGFSVVVKGLSCCISNWWNGCEARTFQAVNKLGTGAFWSSHWTCPASSSGRDEGWPDAVSNSPKNLLVNHLWVASSSHYGHGFIFHPNEEQCVALCTEKPDGDWRHILHLSLDLLPLIWNKSPPFFGPSSLLCGRRLLNLSHFSSHFQFQIFLITHKNTWHL